jgi:prevent-host-death family protein
MYDVVAAAGLRRSVTMQVFRAQDMQRNVSAVQEAAMTEPVLITYHDRPRLVLMSIAEYARIRGREKVVGGIEDMDEGIAKAILENRKMPLRG